MRKRLACCCSAFLFVLVALAMAASPASSAPGQMAAAHTEAAVLPPAEPASANTAIHRSDSADLRDSAALVLVGTMLIGLAAAVRRTA